MRVSRVLFCVIIWMVVWSGCRREGTPSSVGLPGNPTPNPVTTVQKDTVRMLGHWKGEGGRERFLEELIREFNFLHQDIHVSLTQPEDDAEVRAFFSPTQRHQDRALFIASMVRSGRYKYDIVPMMGNIYNMVGQALGDLDWGKRYLVDFSTIPGFVETQKPYVYHNPVYRRNTRGMVVGPIVEGAYYVFYYNEDLARKMGLTIRDDGMTFDELVDIVDQIQAYNRSHGTRIAPIYESSDWTTLSILFEHLFKSEIGFDDAYRIPSTFTPRNREALLKTFKAIETLQKKGVFLTSDSEIIWSQTLAYPLEDRVFFYLNGSWMYNIWEVINPEKAKRMVPVELPVFKPCAYYPGLYIMDFAVMRQSPRVEKAIQFMMHWCSKDVSNDWTRYAKSPSGIVGDIEPSGIGGDIHERFSYRMDQKYGMRISFFDTDWDYLFGRNHPLPPNYLTERLREVIRGEKTAEAVYREILRFFK